ncbi:CorA family divalent cation transporter [Polaribacter sp.]|uniref:CorA family divalent cation transporter n=1 Tax=Polaribacter sp. TaxID=1920175 RepID=UPI003F6D9028
MGSSYKKVSLYIKSTIIFKMVSEFLKNTSLISYSKKDFEKSCYTSISDVVLTNTTPSTEWLNTYGLNFREIFKKIITNNKLDDFLIKLFMDEEHSNKVILLDDLAFISTKILKTENSTLETEQLFFIISSGFLWSIQEKQGDYFNWIRERLQNNMGIIRRKKADYLLFLILESIIDNYEEAYLKNAALNSDELNATTIKPTPEFTAKVEARKQELFNFKKATLSLRDTIIKLQKIEIKEFDTKYFSELKEQINNLTSNIDFELQELESKINLIFSIQGHRLNEVMKTLTILSVIFIPLTFLAGIYGMNFTNIPELNWKYGYFILLGIMVLVTIGAVWYFKRKKWF